MCSAWDMAQGHAAMVCFLPHAHPSLRCWCSVVCCHLCDFNHLDGSWPTPWVSRLLSRTLPSVPDLPRRPRTPNVSAQPLGEVFGLCRTSIARLTQSDLCCMYTELFMGTNRAVVCVLTLRTSPVCHFGTRHGPARAMQLWFV